MYSSYAIKVDISMKESICVLIMTMICSMICSIFILLIRDVDENNMDSYDREYGHAGEGRTRDIFGTIYNKDGSVSILRTLLDGNPYI